MGRTIGITLFSLIGFGLLAAGPLLARLPSRVRPYAEAALQTLLFLGAVAGGYRALFSGEGVVARGDMSEAFAIRTWMALTGLAAAATIYRIARMFVNTNHTTGRGTSA